MTRPSHPGPSSTVLFALSGLLPRPPSTPVCLLASSRQVWCFGLPINDICRIFWFRFWPRWPGLGPPGCQSSWPSFPSMLALSVLPSLNTDCITFLARQWVGVCNMDQAVSSAAQRYSGLSGSSDVLRHTNNTWHNLHVLRSRIIRVISDSRKKLSLTYIIHSTDQDHQTIIHFFHKCPNCIEDPHCLTSSFPVYPHPLVKVLYNHIQYFTILFFQFIYYSSIHTHHQAWLQTALHCMMPTAPLASVV